MSVTPDEIRARLRGAAWFGHKVVGGHCMGRQEYTRVRAAYNGAQGLGWGACAACIEALRGSS